MPVHKAIYDTLKKAASEGGILHYAEVAPLAGLDMSRPDDRNTLSVLLGDISEFEHQNGRPLLSAVVVLAGSEQPGQGFFSLARDLGLPVGHDETAFFSAELTRVYDEWSKP